MGFLALRNVRICMFLRIEKGSGWILKLDIEMHITYMHYCWQIEKKPVRGFPNSKKCKYQYVSKDWRSN
mgnify:CR=1 FL=1